MPVLATPLARCVLLRAPTVAAAPPAWAPTDLAPNLLVWNEADGITQADGSGVSSWTDLSGNGRHATQATAGLQPTYETGELGGKPVLRFDTDAVLSTASFDPAIGTGDFTMAVVVKSPSVTASGYRNMMSHGAELPALYWTGDGAGLNVNLYHIGDHRFSTDLAASTWYTLIVVRTSGVINLLINGTSDATTNIADTNGFGTAAMHYGAGGGAAALNSDLAAGLFVNRAMTSPERTDLQDYWRTKYAHY